MHRNLWMNRWITSFQKQQNQKTQMISFTDKQQTTMKLMHLTYDI